MYEKYVFLKHCFKAALPIIHTKHSLHVLHLKGNPCYKLVCRLERNGHLEGSRDLMKDVFQFRLSSFTAGYHTKCNALEFETQVIVETVFRAKTTALYKGCMRSTYGSGQYSH